MSYSIVHAADIPRGRGPHPAASPYDKRVSERLDLRAFELYQVELPPGASTEAHDHLADKVEDVYAVIRGSGWLVVDGQDVPLAVGHFVAVTRESTRFVRAGDDGCVIIAVCA